MLLNRLINQGCYNNAIIMDSSEYDQMLSSEFPYLRFHGQYYNCEAVSLRGSHHPKMILLTGEKAGRLLIGSGNLTDSGCSKNLEIFSKFDYSEDDRQSLGVFRSALQITKELVKRFALSPAIQKNLSILEGSTPWLQDEPIPSPTRLLSSLDKPILVQLRELIPEAGFDEIVLLAPFFDAKLVALDEIIKQFPAKQTRLIIPTSRTNFPYDHYEQKFSNKVSLHKVDKVNTGNRHCHAKAMYFRTGKIEYLLSGSPNISQAALLSTTAWGNLELATLCRKEDGSLSQVLSQIISKERVSHKSEIEFLDIVEAEPRGKLKIRLTSAFLDQKSLNLTFDTSSEIKAEVIVNAHSLGEYRLILGQPLSLPFRYDQESSPVVYLKSGNDASNRLLISNTFIHVKSDLGYIARKVASLSQLIGQEYSSLIFGFSPNIRPVGDEDTGKLRSLAQVEMEEEGEEKVLPENRYFTIATDPIWENSVSEIDDSVDYHYKNNLIETIVSHLLFSFKTPQAATSTEANHLNQSHTHRVEVGDVSLAFKKLNKFVSDHSKKELQMAKEQVLSYEMTEDLIQYIPFLVASYSGFKTEDYSGVAITLDNYLEASTLLLERLWLVQKSEDFVVADLTLQVASLSYLLPLSLALTDFNIWLLKHYPESVDNIYSSLRKCAGIKASVLATLKLYTSDADKIFSSERIHKIIRLFVVFADYQPMSQAEMLRSIHQPLFEADIYNDICTDLPAHLKNRYDTLFGDYQTKQVELDVHSRDGGILWRQVQNQEKNELAAKLDRLNSFVNNPM